MLGRCVLVKNCWQGLRVKTEQSLVEVGQSIRPTTLLALREGSELGAAPETLSVVYCQSHLVLNHAKSLEGETTSEGYHPRVPSQNTNLVFTSTINFCCTSQPVSICVCVCFCMLHLSNEDSCSFCVPSAVGEGPKERPFFVFLLLRELRW